MSKSMNTGKLYGRAGEVSTTVECFHECHRGKEKIAHAAIMSSLYTGTSTKHAVWVHAVQCTLSTELYAYVGGIYMYKIREVNSLLQFKLTPVTSLPVWLR